MKKEDARKIYDKIKKYEKIVIARHIGADPDALASQIALRDSIKETFPKKKAIAVGALASRLKFIGSLDKMNDEYYDNALLIVTDTPDKKRVDDVNVDKFSTTIKIDHHPFVETYCDMEFIDLSSSSTCQMIIELINHTKLVMTKSIAEKLFIGLVSDSERFLFDYTSNKTFSLVSKLVGKYDIDFYSLYHDLYLRPLSEFRFMGYIQLNIEVTKSGLAYIKITKSILDEFKVDVGAAGNIINTFTFIKGIKVFVIFTEDIKNNVIRASLRSSGPIINRLSEQYNGGGHKFASGARLVDFNEVDEFVDKLDELCMEYDD